MTLAELKSLSEGLKTDAEFLAHLEVRRVWWKCIGDDESSLPDLDAAAQYQVAKVLELIPGSLADAVEALREKVEVFTTITSGCARSAWSVPRCADDSVCCERLNGAIDVFFPGWLSIDVLIEASLRERFVVFAAALGAVEVA